jgi:uncharacterized cupin superfamily protein
MSKPQRIVNIAELALQDGGNGKGFQAKLGRAGPLTDELFYIVAGSGEVRLDDQTQAVRAGDLIASPAGTEAHQIFNTGASELRYLAISDINTVDIIEYPDSGKVGMAAGVKDGNLSSASYKAMGRVTPADYFDGEDTNDKR